MNTYALTPEAAAHIKMALQKARMDYEADPVANSHQVIHLDPALLQPRNQQPPAEPLPTDSNSPDSQLSSNSCQFVSIPGSAPIETQKAKIENPQPPSTVDSTSAGVIADPATSNDHPEPSIENPVPSTPKITNSQTDNDPRMQLIRLLRSRIENQLPVPPRSDQDALALDPRPSTLDSSVTALDPRLSALDSSVTALDPRPSTLDSTSAGAIILDQVRQRYEHYLVLPPGAAVALTLWTAHAHCFTAFRLTPRLNLQSPEPGCGKTTTLDVIASLVPRPIRTENLTAPILFRLVDQSQPTLLLDEVDSYLPQADELRGLLNAGHKRGACAYRCGDKGKSSTLRSFKAFAPAVLSGLGKLPGTLHDRSIHIPLIEAEPGQIKAWFDESHADLEASLNQQLARWTTENFEAIKDCASRILRPNSELSTTCPATAAINSQRPTLPPIHNRLGDNWRPLFAIAQIAGGDWPQLAVDAFTTLSARAGLDARGLGILLLKDIQHVFETAGVDRISSRQLVAELRAIDGGQWEMAHEGGPINETWLGRRLSQLGVRSRTTRIGQGQSKGYDLADFQEAFTRFLPNHGES